MPQILTNSAKNGYKKNPRRVCGPGCEAKIDAAVAVDMMAITKNVISHVPTAPTITTPEKDLY